MCGIAGIFAYKLGKYDLADSIERMNKAISHRGPDDEGFVVFQKEFATPCKGDDSANYDSSFYNFIPQTHIQNFKGVEINAVLAHRRLSIIDVSANGHQPMSDGGGKIWITFNGEIYNYVELKRDLQTRGFIFRTNSDTEVVLLMYLVYGTECVNHFNGMWSFIIYDTESNFIFASRDRLGVKPFYYVFNEEIFSFASEQKALYNRPFVNSSINDAAVFDYFVLSKIEHEPQSFFKNIIELFPSHSMLINLDEWKIVTWKYHEFQTNNSYQKLSVTELDDLKKLLKEKVKRAVEIRLRSDIEVGACLSGGIDSSAIVCLMREINHEANFKVFTASSEHKEIDETPWADIVAKHTNSNHFKVYPKREELETDLRDLIYCQDVPIWSTSTYAQYRVLKLAAENGVRVVLDGQGSDELFAGYPNYYLNYWRQLVKDLGVFKMAFESAYFKKFWSNTSFAFKRWLADYAVNNLSPERQLQFRKAIHPELMVLNDDFLKTHLTRLNAGTDRIEPLNQKLLYDQGVGRLKTYLKCEDRCSMWHSVEARTPFSDDIELINLANSIGYNHKVVKTSLKNILKDSLKEVLPEPIYNRKDKKGFVTPNNLWLSQMGVLAIDLNNSLSNTYVDKRAFKKHYPFLFSNQDTADNGRLFKLIAFPLWKNTFNL